MGSTGGTFAIFSIPLLLMNDHFAQLLPGPMLYSLLGSNLRCMMICWQTCSFTEVFFFIVPATKEPENGTQCVCRSIYTEGYGQHQHKDMPEMGTSFDQIQFKVCSSLERSVRQQVKDSTFAQTGCLIDMVYRCGRCGSFPREWLDRHSWFGRRTSSRLEYIIGFVKPKTGAGKIVLGTVLIEFHQLYHHFEQGIRVECESSPGWCRTGKIPVNTDRFNADGNFSSGELYPLLKPLLLPGTVWWISKYVPAVNATNFKLCSAAQWSNGWFYFYFFVNITITTFMTDRLATWAVTGFW